MAGAHRGADATAPAYKAIEITASDVTIFEMCRAIYVGGIGNLSVRMSDGHDITFVGVPVGVFPIQADMVYAATTATDLVALY